MTKRELPKHVYRQRNGIYFQRRGWRSQKFDSEFGTPEFWKEYAGILSQKDQPRKIIAQLRCVDRQLSKVTSLPEPETSHGSRLR